MCSLQQMQELSLTPSNVSLFAHEICVGVQFRVRVVKLGMQQIQLLSNFNEFGYSISVIEASCCSSSILRSTVFSQKVRHSKILHLEESSPNVF